MKKLTIDYTKSGYIVFVLFLTSLLAFWPTYYSVFFSSGFYIHLHVFFAALWFGMLIVQPCFIKSRRISLHRYIGKLSGFITPMVVISIILLAQNRLTATPESFYPFQTYILYLQLSLALVFAITYGLAIYFRKTMAIHSRYMVATSFTFIDPIFARLINIYIPDLASNSQWFTFGAINVLLIALSIMDRNNRKAKWVYPSLLLIYLVVEIPIFFNLTGMNWWQNFADWFGSVK